MESTVYCDLRQLLFPGACRIARPPRDHLGLAHLVGLLGAGRLQEESTVAVPEPRPLAASDVAAPLLAEVCTGLWRMQRRLSEIESGKEREALRHTQRRVESVLDVLAQAGLEIQDHTGTAYDPGLSIKVIAFEAVSGIGRETVTETIRPSIYLRGERIQMGEVLVGTP